MPLASLFRRGRRRQAVLAAYHIIVARAREPVLFAAWEVPDTLDGRFELLALHAFLVLNRLKADRAETAEFAQDLFDTMFADLDRAVREMGATDVGVGRHVKAMARGFYGRVVAYERGLAEGDAMLADALRRNLFGTAAPEAPQLARACRYLRRQAEALAPVPVAALMAGEVRFAPVEDEEAAQ
ncbi:MAG TPA: ubiquinol-cytochrome C chaperone family protein [Stellaceae bacterium]|nr:ubiquinol-cytochrome C chaperone family protein [Stellaceae bacterium]